MSALFKRVIGNVFTTFDYRNRAAFQGNFTMLKELVDQLTAKDLNIDFSQISDQTVNELDKPSCTYIHIFNNDFVSMSVFILQADYTMPLHDHPKMHGILKGICGKLRVQSYTQISPQSSDDTLGGIEVVEEVDKVITSASECVALTPTERNFHEITAVGEVAAFFDILSPPYDADMPIYGKRKCNFYRKISEDESRRKFTLHKIPVPSSYYCDVREYNAPDFLREYDN